MWLGGVYVGVVDLDLDDTFFRQRGFELYDVFDVI